ncbi:MAG: peptide-methionine (S)-S-oxide reductase MsrA [Chloroflexi bacterium]|nr:MAG: peptide-methionine (S)-S-oxide reductase MsrA [Chloroflexota bacterium]
MSSRAIRAPVTSARSGAADRQPAAYRCCVVSPEKFPDPQLDTPVPAADGEASAVLAGGCFWCVEAVYKQLDGVRSVTSGYAGGTSETADYDVVSSGRTGHAEAVEVRFDPAKVSYGQLLKVFFSIAHDPTTRDRQGPDVGKQYRSAIFYANDEQRRVAEAYIKQLDAAKVFDAPIVTELKALDRFYEAESYHQDYAERNPNQPYIVYNAAPKVQKVRKYFADRVKVT